MDLPGGVTVYLQGNIGDNLNAYHYIGDESDVIITYSPMSQGLNGHAMINGESFVLENCLDEGHVWKKLNLESLGENEGVDYLGLENLISEVPAPEWRTLEDTTSMATYSVKFYYTADFAAVTPDIQGFIDQVIAETNQGYANSAVPLTIKQHCSAEEASIKDETSASTMLTNFVKMKSSPSALRDTADTAALLVNNFGSCGIGYVNVISAKYTFSVTKKSCAVGYYSFGHEVGHNIGLMHNPATGANKYYPYGTGHLIAAGSAKTGYRTILAYNANGHSTRVNYYSNPNVVYKATGTPTGIAEVSDNARLLVQNRMKLAAIGDETGTCGKITVAPITTAKPPATKPPAGNCKQLPNTRPFIKTRKTVRRIKTADVCQDLCTKEEACDYWSFLYKKSVKGRKCQLFQFEFIAKRGWTSAPKEC